MLIGSLGAPSLYVLDGLMTRKEAPFDSLLAVLVPVVAFLSAYVFSLIVTATCMVATVFASRWLRFPQYITWCLVFAWPVVLALAQGLTSDAELGFWIGAYGGANATLIWLSSKRTVADAGA